MHTGTRALPSLREGTAVAESKGAAESALEKRPSRRQGSCPSRPRESRFVRASCEASGADVRAPTYAKRARVRRGFV
jgi:hypothetical protein